MQSEAKRSTLMKNLMIGCDFSRDIMSRSHCPKENLKPVQSV